MNKKYFNLFLRYVCGRQKKNITLPISLKIFIRYLKIFGGNNASEIRVKHACRFEIIITEVIILIKIKSVLEFLKERVIESYWSSRW